MWLTLSLHHAGHTQKRATILPPEARSSQPRPRAPQTTLSRCLCPNQPPRPPGGPFPAPRRFHLLDRGSWSPDQAFWGEPSTCHVSIPRRRSGGAQGTVSTLSVLLILECRAPSRLSRLGSGEGLGSRLCPTEIPRACRPAEAQRWGAGERAPPPVLCHRPCAGRRIPGLALPRVHLRAAGWKHQVLARLGPWGPRPP